MRKLVNLEVCAYYFEYYAHGTAIRQHKAWFDDLRYIVSMRPAMISGNMYRLTLDTDEEIVVSENHIITVEWY